MKIKIIEKDCLYSHIIFLQEWILIHLLFIRGTYPKISILTPKTDLFRKIKQKKKKTFFISGVETSKRTG